MRGTWVSVSPRSRPLAPSLPSRTAAAAGSSKSVPNWAAPQIATVVAHKLMGAKSVKKFHPNATLTNKTLATLAADLKEQLGSPLRPPPGTRHRHRHDHDDARPTPRRPSETTTTTGSDPSAPRR